MLRDLNTWTSHDLLHGITLGTLVDRFGALKERHGGGNDYEKQGRCSNNTANETWGKEIGGVMERAWAGGGQPFYLQMTTN